MNTELQLDPSNIHLRGLTLSDYKYLKDFKCGNGSMELFLEVEATERHIRREASTTLVFYNERLAGYFTLYRSKILLSEDSIHEDQIQVLPSITRDALEIARLAVDTDFQHKGLGTYIIEYIKGNAYLANEMYIKLEALYERWEWYKKKNFYPVIEEEIDPDKNEGFVYMIMSLYDEKLIDEYFDI